MRNLGLIGGLGPGATVHYYEKLTEGRAGEMMIVQAHLETVQKLVQNGDRQGLAEYFARLIERMAHGGADIAAIPAITPHICIRELEPISPLPLVNIIDAVGAAIRARGLRRVALFGTRYVVSTNMFGMLDGVEVVMPEEIDAIHEAYMQTVEGKGDPRATLSRIARGLPVDAIVLAGTDLVTIFNETNTDFPHVDSAGAHIAAILHAIKADQTDAGA
jgi:aspartate racemase